MVQVGARIRPRCRMDTLLIKWPRIIGVASVGEIDRTKPRERRAVPAVAGRQHTIEHINATFNGL